MIFYIEDELAFPPVNLANDDGLLCFGGDLKPERLILAYSSGIFPWADEPVLWFSPDPRMIIDLDNWKPSKSLRRTLRNNTFSISADKHFEEVMENCASTRETTWISDEFIENYSELHKMGLAHSLEISVDGELAGGLYGLSLGKAFLGESMFHKVTDASKVAFSHLIYFMRYYNFSLLDCQISNPHLTSLGGIDVSRDDYLKKLDKALEGETVKGNWGEMLGDYLKDFKIP
jgi:leucyl/phenylalanyl-tRNA--protein transferase